MDPLSTSSTLLNLLNLTLLLLTLKLSLVSSLAPKKLLPAIVPNTNVKPEKDASELQSILLSKVKENEKLRLIIDKLRSEISILKVLQGHPDSSNRSGTPSTINPMKLSTDPPLKKSLISHLLLGLSLAVDDLDDGVLDEKFESGSPSPSLSLSLSNTSEMTTDVDVDLLLMSLLHSLSPVASRLNAGKDSLHSALHNVKLERTALRLFSESAELHYKPKTKTESKIKTEPKIKIESPDMEQYLDFGPDDRLGEETLAALSELVLDSGEKLERTHSLPVYKEKCGFCVEGGVCLCEDSKKTDF